MQRSSAQPAARPAEQGFMLLGLIVAIFLILLVLGVAAPRLAKSLRRDREVEAVQRGKQYVRAIQLYYRKTGHYPGSLDQLEKTNNIRYLRQRYVDPMTGKADWRLIHVGEAKTTVKGFFGQPLAGLPGAAGGLGGGISSNGQSGTSAAGSGNPSSPFGSSGSSQPGTGSTFGGSSSSSTFGGSSTGAASGTSPGTSGTTGTSTQSGTGSSFGSIAGGTGAAGAGTAGSSGGLGSQSATSFTGTGAPIVGIGSAATGDSILVLNEQTSYPKWEFLYDPRVEQMKAKAATLGGPASIGSSSSFGGSATSPGLNGTAAPGAATSPSPAPSPTPNTAPQP